MDNVNKETQQNQIVPQQTNATVSDVANWLLNQVTTNKVLLHEDAVYGIRQKFGDNYIYLNSNDNPAIPKKVLNKFKEISRYTVKWDSAEQLWRLRQKGDQAGRQV